MPPSLLLAIHSSSAIQAQLFIKVTFSCRRAAVSASKAKRSETAIDRNNNFKKNLLQIKIILICCSP